MTCPSGTRIGFSSSVLFGLRRAAALRVYGGHPHFPPEEAPSSCSLVSLETSQALATEVLASAECVPRRQTQAWSCPGSVIACREEAVQEPKNVARGPGACTATGVPTSTSAKLAASCPQATPGASGLWRRRCVGKCQSPGALYHPPLQFVYTPGACLAACLPHLMPLGTLSFMPA